jgi:ketosteroid isomerase-like protein
VRTIGKLLGVAGLAALVLGPAACAARARAPVSEARRFTPDDRAAVSAVLEQQANAWNRGDLDAYMDGYARSEALVFTSGTSIRKGWQQAFDHYKQKYGAAPGTMGHLTFELLSIDAVGTDGAIVLGKWRLTNTPAAADGVFTVVLERRPEGWRIVHDHTSSTPPDRG